ncbi:hypothetical protein KVR01_001034 [Diaporthe batatas]|uniref:uncharacterized protein n=1 Tax=Diaporthe batatas TaxID=748121 RepID=UPI001D039F73|nr:uncharacterized protein KVR01_001034 [Diaporthe batatas]KAG8170289.1 hypothetical protein KVR01_001034 [Diaporthe batatas]
MDKAEVEFGGGPYRMMTMGGPVMVLPAKFADEIRNDDRLSFNKSAEQDYHAHLPAFEPFRGDITDLLANVAKKYLTKLIGKTTRPLSEEAARTLETKLGESPEWQQVSLENTTLQLASRMTARVTAGEDLCRNETWLRNTMEYTINAAKAAKILQLLPAPVRHIAHLFLPQCREMRAQLVTARALVQSVLKKRKHEHLEAASKGSPAPCYDDAIDWGALEYQNSKGDLRGSGYQPALFQLQTSVVGLHSTTDLLTQTLINILLRPELIAPLREEIVNAISDQGWSKPSLHKLHLMDSIMKETQRLKPLELITMHRMATSDVKLSDGSLIPKYTCSVLANTTRLDPMVYENPQEFDAYRFLRMRANADLKYQAPMVSTGINSLGFGHGLHVCPGRFFATDVVKMALCHLLLKYDIELAPDCRPEPYKSIGFHLDHDRSVQILIRRRKEEIDMNVL